MIDSSMNPEKQDPHWTEERFSDYVLGLTTGHEANLHLDRCAICREELDRFQESIASFNQVSMAWSERRAHGIARERAVKPAFAWFPTAAWALAAGLALAVGLPMAMEHRQEPAAIHVAQVHSQDEMGSTQIASVGDENSPAAIERDNKMMMAVADELNRADPTPAIYGVPAAQHDKRQAQAREN